MCLMWTVDTQTGDSRVEDSYNWDKEVGRYLEVK